MCILKPMNENSIFKHQFTTLTAPMTSAFEPRLTWQWDEHFACLLAEFSVDHEVPVFMTASKLFPQVWDKNNIKQADPFLRHRAGEFGLLTKNQRLLTIDTTGQQDIMLSWWPWGHGATLSMRIFRANSAPYVPDTSLLNKIKRMLGVAN